MFKVRVQNFQSIVDITLEVDGFTVLTGSNNVGKSAIFRALRGVFTNPPPSFVRKGCKHSTVELWSGDAHVKWEKGRGVNRYALSKAGAVQHFPKPGSSAPPEVCEAFGVRPVSLGDKKTWPQFADQFTGPVYLLDQPGHVLADVVASPDRMRVLGHALSQAEKDRRKASSTLKVKREDQDKLQAKLEALSSFEALSAAVDDLEERRVRAERVRTGQKKLEGLKEVLESAKDVRGVWGLFSKPTFQSSDSLEKVQRARILLKDLKYPLEAAKAAVDSYQGLDPQTWSVLGEGSIVAEFRNIRRLRTALLKSSEIRKILSGFEAFEFEEDTRSEKLLRALKVCRSLQEDLQGAKAAWQQLQGSSVTLGDQTDTLNEIHSLRETLKTGSGLRGVLVRSHRNLLKVETELSLTVKEREEFVATMPDSECPLCGAPLRNGQYGRIRHQD